MTSTSFPLTFPILFDDAFDNAYERMKNRLTTPYYTEPDGNIDKLIQMQALQVELARHTTDDIEVAHKLAEATGYSLDQWGVITKVVRKTAESDDDYRARQYVQIAIYMRSATPQDIVSTAADVLGVATDRVEFIDGTTPASFCLKAFIVDISAAGIDLADFRTIMDVAKAGGVDMTINTIGSFTCRGIGDLDDITKAYTNIANDNPNGGRYSGVM